MERFVTYMKENSDEVLCMTEREYIECIELDHADWAEWVWQYAQDKRTAISQHYAKHDEWQENPSKETYQRNRKKLK